VADSATTGTGAWVVSGRSLLDAAVSDPSPGPGAGVVSGCKLLDAAVSDTRCGVGAGVATGRKLRDASVADSATTGTGAWVVSGRSLPGCCGV